MNGLDGLAAALAAWSGTGAATQEQAGLAWAEAIALAVTRSSVLAGRRVG